MHTKHPQQDISKFAQRSSLGVSLRQFSRRTRARFLKQFLVLHVSNHLENSFISSAAVAQTRQSFPDSDGALPATGRTTRATAIAFASNKTHHSVYVLIIVGNTLDPLRSVTRTCTPRTGLLVVRLVVGSLRTTTGIVHAFVVGRGRCHCEVAGVMPWHAANNNCFGTPPVLVRSARRAPSRGSRDIPGINGSRAALSCTAERSRHFALPTHCAMVETSKGFILPASAAMETWVQAHMARPNLWFPFGVLALALDTLV